jgi:prepilin-type N-terminal cleavage/methylation domain-containing protein
MMYFKTIETNSKGFTLVEIIVTIVAMGILGAIFINFMGTALNSSWNAVEITRDEAGSEALMEQIISEYVADINSNPAIALGNIVTNYGGQTINGITVTTQYIEFDGSGNEQAAGADYLKVVLQPSGLGPPAITGRFPLITIFARNRDTNDDHFVLY